MTQQASGARPAPWASVLVAALTVHVAVLPPVDVSQWKLPELGERIAEVRQMYIDTLENWPEKTP